MSKVSQFERDSRFTEIENHSLVGLLVEHYSVGLKTLATVTKVFEDQYSITVLTSHDPIRWGDQLHTVGSFSIRKFDNRICGEPKLFGQPLTRADFEG